MAEDTQNMKPNILIVEDEKTLRDSVTSTLQKAGYEVSEAGDVAGLLEALEGPSPVALILDLSLPDGNGLEVLPAIKKGWPTTRIIILTGHGTVDVAEKAYKLDRQIILQSKPFDGEMLKALLALALSSGTVN